MSTREISTHKVNGLNDALKLLALGNIGPGGADNSYEIFIPDSVPLKPGVTVHTLLNFQNGPIASPEDYNGLTVEVLAAVLIDRLRGFQVCRDPDGNFSKAPGLYACRENAIALTHFEEGLMWLQQRTRERQARGVEGSMQK